MKNIQRVLKVLGSLVVQTVSCLWLVSAQAETQATTEIIKTIESDAHLEALISCQLVGYPDAICVVTERNDTTSVDTPTRTLIIYDAKESTPKSIFQYSTFNPLLSLRWVDNSTIIAVWETGSAMTVTIFRVIAKSVNLALEIGTKFLPEVVDLDGDWSKEVLISHGETVVTDKEGRRIIIPTRASIYKFAKGKYSKVKEVPWKDRLRVSF